MFTINAHKEIIEYCNPRNMNIYDIKYRAISAFGGGANAPIAHPGSATVIKY